VYCKNAKRYIDCKCNFHNFQYFAAKSIICAFFCQIASVSVNLSSFIETFAPRAFSYAKDNFLVYTIFLLSFQLHNQCEVFSIIYIICYFKWTYVYLISLFQRGANLIYRSENDYFEFQICRFMFSSWSFFLFALNYICLQNVKNWSLDLLNCFFLVIAYHI